MSQEPKMAAACYRKIARSASPRPALAAGGAFLRIEAEALAAIAACSTSAFERCVDRRATRGRVVVAGWARATATVALQDRRDLRLDRHASLYDFIRPEASHGDLGMITADDVVLALSNSEETWSSPHT